MPSNKPKVSAFLDDAELKAFEDYKTKEGISNSEAVKRLIRGKLIDSTDTALEGTLNTTYDERVHQLEGRMDAVNDTVCCSVETMERIGEQLAYLQDEVNGLRRQVRSEAVEWLTDDQVASYVGAREETVREWRLGLRKPRGKRVLEALSKLELNLGRWKMKD